LALALRSRNKMKSLKIRNGFTLLIILSFVLILLNTGRKETVINTVRTVTDIDGNE
jgi:hypothetical protein